MKSGKKNLIFHFLPLILFILITLSCEQSMVEYKSFEEFPVLEKEFPGVGYSLEKTTFTLWSPEAEEVKVNLYKSGSNSSAFRELELKYLENGIWSEEIPGDFKNIFYTFQAKFNGEWQSPAPDPGALAVGVNGDRGMIVDMKETNPSGWAQDTGPTLNSPTDAVIYELHIRDISSDPESGITNKGKFLGLAETGTRGPNDISTGLDHIKMLGVTHIHILPAFDFRTIDESKPETPQYNWGYDPKNYNTPEGSYATDPNDGKVRIREFKTMVQTLHENGLGVILDVVYNHTGATENSNFNLLVPGYFYRHNPDGSFSNASACGNETASERTMMRNFMIQSLSHWVKEYHVDGFRFDLMGIHDIETMNEISKTLKSLNPNILLYGEGWTASSSPLREEFRALKANTRQLNGIAVFSDELRDGVKGHWADHRAKGFVSGATEQKESVKFGIVGGIDHPQIDYAKVNNSNAPWANHPTQLVNYVSCHDNHTLLDKLKIANPDASVDDLKKMHLLSNTIVLTSQGIPFLHAGVEMMRTKQGVENSFESPDSINSIQWNWKNEHQDVVNYYQELIKLRKDHPAFRIAHKDMVLDHLKFLPTNDSSIIAYQITGHANNDSWKDVIIIFNGSAGERTFTIPEGEYQIIIDNYKINDSGDGILFGGEIKLKPISALLLVSRN